MHERGRQKDAAGRPAGARRGLASACLLAVHVYGSGGFSSSRPSSHTVSR
jgi:hypothetical protein